MFFVEPCMKNVLDQKPTTDLPARLKGCADFVSTKDIFEKSVLDIGCGFGSYVLFALEKGALHATGVEITEEDIKTAQKHIHSEKATFLVGSAIQLPVADTTFDTVVSFDVIEHIPKHTESQMFTEVMRVLKPGGSFYLSTPFRSIASNLCDPAWFIAGHRHYSQKELEDFGNKHGFTCELVETRGGWWTFIGILNMYISKWIFRRQMFFQNFFQKKETEEYLKNRGFINILVHYKKPLL